MAFGALNKVRSVNLFASSSMPLAIDFGVSSLKILQISSTTHPSLVAAAQLPTPPDCVTDPSKRIAFQTENLPKLIKAGGFKGKKGICSIPTAALFCKHMQFPASSNVDLSTLVRSAVAAQIGCPENALLYRHVVAGQVGSTNKQEVICLAASQELVRRLMNAMVAAKLEPAGITPEPLAAVRAFDSMTQRATDKDLTTLYLDIGYGSTTVMITHGSSLVFAKPISIGGYELDEAISRQLKCTMKQAMEARLAATHLVPTTKPASQGQVQDLSRQPATAHVAAAPAAPVAPVGGQAVAEDRRTPAEPMPRDTGLPSHNANQPVPNPPSFDLSDTLEALTDEIAMCVRYHESVFPGRRVGRAIFIGGESRHRGLCEHLARTLRVHAHVADPLSAVTITGKEPCTDVSFASSQPGWTVPLGLAITPAQA